MIKSIYTSNIRTILEQSCALWHKSITEENSNDLERVQKNALRIILGNKYVNYEESLNDFRFIKYKTRKTIIKIWNKLYRKSQNQKKVQIEKEKT